MGLSDRRVSEVMQTEVVSLAREDRLDLAADIMRLGRIRHMPVLEEGRLVGIVTETDLLRALLEGEPVLEVSVKEQGNLGKLGERIGEEIDAVRRARDELRVRLHLAKADARDRWEALEHRYRELESKLELVAREAGQPVREVGEAVKQLARELREGYRKIRDAAAEAGSG